MNNAQTVLVFGATGQQGGSVARALLHRGWRVRALVRDPFSAGAAALAARGAELVVGTFEDRAAMRSAMAGVDGVFSVQPSSPGGTVTDEQEVRYGITIADLAVECGVKHLVYSSGSATGETPTGVAHYDTKAEIERHIRRLPLAATIVRPATFMELLVMPGFGLDEGRFQFFMLPEGRMQVLAVEDIGHLVAAVFAAPAGRPIPYSRFSDEVLAASPFLHKLTGLVDDGRLAGHADLDAMRQLHPQLHTFAGWLAGPGRPAFERALTSAASWAFDR
ncbi:TPA: NmrA/HSCARG family protein [Klebsiella pneumoniae]|nr:NmrA/HSCARG family protein [Klebsiella pneumoniae]